LDLGITDVDNFGMASYVNGVFKGNCSAYFGIEKGEDDTLTMGLMLGTETSIGSITTTKIFIPCEVEQQTIKVGKREKQEYVYMLNGTPLSITETVDDKGLPNGKFYLSIRNDDEDTEFTFPFLIDKSLEFQPTEIKTRWRTGVFHEVLRTFGVGQSRTWIQANKAFTSHFVKTGDKATWNKPELKNGVYMLLKNGKIKHTLAGSHPNITSDIIQSDWEIIATSHPDLLISVQNKETKEYEAMRLEDASNIQFTSAQTNNEGFTFFSVQGVHEWEDVVMCHIVKPSDRNITHAPVSTLSKMPARIRFQLSNKFPHLVKIYNELVGNILPQTSISTVDSVEAMNDIHPPIEWNTTASTNGKSLVLPNGTEETTRDF
jgi:hypothetical protein